MPKKVTHACPECPLKFPNKKALAKHKGMHKVGKVKEEKKTHFKCPFEGCPYTSEQGHFARHIKTHTENYKDYCAEPELLEKKRSCVLCHPEKKVAYATYKRHLRDQHGVAEDKNVRDWPLYFAEGAQQTKENWESSKREKLSMWILKKKVDSLVCTNYEMSKKLRHFQILGPKAKYDPTDSKIKKLKNDVAMYKRSHQEEKELVQVWKLHHDNLYYKNLELIHKTEDLTLRYKAKLEEMNTMVDKE